MKRFKKRYVLLIGLLLAGWIWYGNRNVGVTEYKIADSVPDGFDGYRIAQVSDFHNANIGKKVTEKLRKADCDIIVMTGDMIDSRWPDIDRSISLIKEMIEIAPCYYVNGNNEARISDEYELFKAEMEELGVTVLENGFCDLEKNGSRVKLIGLKDTGFALNRKIGDVLEETMPEGEDYKILLAHRPEYFEEYNGVDLVLSGHAHGGQFRLPFIGAVFAPGQGLFPKYYQGLFEDRGVKMIISRGLGNSLFPFRINNNPEIVVVELKKG